MKKEFCKVSIHNHLGGEGADRKIDEQYTKECNFDMNLAMRMIDDARNNEFDLIALTQSNRLPAHSYYNLKEYAELKGITLLPGVEFNLKNEEEKFLHTVVVFDEKLNINQIEIKIDEYINENKQNFVTINQFLDLITEYRCIIAAHGLKQKKEGRSASENSATFSELINIADSIPVVVEDNRKYHKQTLIKELKDKLNSRDLEWIEKSESVSSADRLTFGQIASPTYIWGSSTFNDLYYACFMSRSRIKRQEDIVRKVQFISRIEIIDNNTNQVRSEPIECSHGLNAIIGASGSGKTLLLDIIKRKLTGSGIENKTISKNCKYDDLYDINSINLYDIDDHKIDEFSGYNVVEGEILYNKVISAYQSDKKMLFQNLGLSVDDNRIKKIIKNFNTQITEYIKNKVRIKNNNVNIDEFIKNIDSSIKFLDANYQNSDSDITISQALPFDSEIKKIEKNIHEKNSDYEKLEFAINRILEITEKYNPNKEFYGDIEILKKKVTGLVEYNLHKDIIHLNTLEIKNNIQKLIGKATEEYNLKIGNRNNEVAKKQKDIIQNFKNIEEKLIDNIRMDMTLNIPTISEDEIKESLQFEEGNIAKLSFKHVKLNIPKEELKKYFPNNIGNKPKINLSSFADDCVELSESSSVKNFAEIFIDKNYDKEIQLIDDDNDFVDYDVELKNIDGEYENIDRISAGNLSKIYINKMFDEKIMKAGCNTIILYDQPDTNMEKIFILNELVEKLSNLRSIHQVFITTHEPLLVVNADANNIIVAENHKTASKANDIHYYNKSFVGVHGKHELVNEVAQFIDGKPEAVKLRSTIYGGVLNEN